jgi:hypothetical protein
MYCTAFIKNVKTQQDQDKWRYDMPVPIDRFFDKGVEGNIFCQSTPHGCHSQKKDGHGNLMGEG